MVNTSRETANNTGPLEDLWMECNSNRLQMIERGELIRGAELAERMGVTKQAISKGLKSHRFFGIPGPAGEIFYPAFFADERFDRRAVEKVVKSLGSLPGGSKLQFFMTPKVSLEGKTPLEALGNGEVDAAVRAAAGFVER